MTFDEAVDKSRVLSMDGTQQIYGDDVTQLINDLRQEYAPTVEMTQWQANTLIYYLNNAKFFNLLNNEVHDYDFEKLNEEDLMQAWLHPKSIKIIGEKNGR